MILASLATLKQTLIHEQQSPSGQAEKLQQKIEDPLLPEKQLLDLLDEVSKWSSHKMINFSSSQASAALYSMACLGYRNKSSLGKICRTLASSKRSYLLDRMSLPQLVSVLQSLARLQYHSPEVISKVVSRVASALMIKEAGEMTENQNQNASSSPSSSPSFNSGYEMSAKGDARNLFFDLKQRVRTSLLNLKHLDESFFDSQLSIVASWQLL
jgi:hypothetical protein